MKRILAFAALCAGLVALAGQAPAQPPAEAQALFQQRCAACHEPAADRAPALQDLRQRAPADVVRVLTNGSMAPMASGLTPEQVRGLAEWVTGKTLARVGTGGAVGGRLGNVPQPPDPICATHPPIRAGSSDWNGYGSGDLVNSRFQEGPGLTAAEVPRLKVKWAFSYAGGRYGQPTVVGNHLFVSSAANHVYSLDAATGCVHWRKDLPGSPRTSPVVEQRGGRWIVYVGDNARDVYALDAMTGAELWKVNVDSHPRAVLTGSPILYRDHLYVPVSSLEKMTGSTADYGCCTFSGAVVAVDVRTGKVAWSAKMLDPARPTRRNAAGTQMFGPAGAAIWSQPTIDVKRSQLYVATGDSYTEIDAPRSDAIVAVDLATGRIKWTNQVTKNDNFVVGCNPARPGVNCPAGVLGPDYDFGASPILRDIGGGKQIVLSGQKSGIAYGMDPDTGATLWQIKVGAGSALGGIEWGMAADERNLYAGVADIGVPADRAKQGINAIDIRTGRLVWSTPAPNVPCNYVTTRCSHGQSAAPAAIPGAVFSGGQDGWLRAYSSADGRILWEFDAIAQTYSTVNGVRDQPGGGFDGAGPIVAGGRLFVIAGFSGASGVANNPLNVLLAFSVDGK